MALASSLLSRSIPRETLRLSLPSMLSMLLTALARQAEALLLARTGSEAAAAAAACLPLLTLVQTVGFTLGTGAGSFVSRSLGRRQTRDAERTATCALLLCAVFGLPFLLMGLFFSVPVVRLLGVPADGLLLAARYARWFLLAAPLMLFSLTLGCLLRAQGRILAGLAAGLLSALVSLPLAVLLLTRHPLGVTGAGIVILAREGVTLAVLIIFALLGRRTLRPSFRLASPNAAALRAMLPSGIPTLIRQGMMSLTSAAITRIAADFGPAALSGVGMALRVVLVISSAVIGFGQGFQPLFGASFGAGRMGRIREAYAFSLRCIRPALLVIGALLFAFAPRLSALLLPDVVSAAVCTAMLRAQALTLWAQGVITLMTTLTQSVGLPLRGTLVAAGRQGYILLPVMLTLPRYFGLNGLIAAQCVSDLLSLGLGFLLTRPLVSPTLPARHSVFSTAPDA